VVAANDQFALGRQQCQQFMLRRRQPLAADAHGEVETDFDHVAPQAENPEHIGDHLQDALRRLRLAINQAAEQDIQIINSIGIIHGEKDDMVSPKQSMLLSAWLNAVGVQHELIMVKDAPHFGVMFDTEEVRTKVLNFLKSQLN